jgi:hypothetical protein
MNRGTRAAGECTTVCSCRQTGLRKSLSFSLLLAGLEAFLRGRIKRRSRAQQGAAHHVAFYRLARLEQGRLFLDGVAGEPCLNLVSVKGR